MPGAEGYNVGFPDEKQARGEGSCTKCDGCKLLETNIRPENQWLEDEFSFWDDLFSSAMLVLGRVIFLETNRFAFLFFQTILEVENGPLMETQLIFQGPMFH